MAVIPVVDQVQLTHLRAGVVPFFFGEWGGVGPFVPSDALVYYSFDYGIIEWVNQQTSLLTERDADKNVIQSGSGYVKTYSAGEAGLDAGVGDLIEGAATNLMPYSSDSDQWDLINSGVATVPVVTKDFGEIGTTRIQMDLNGGTDSADFSQFRDGTVLGATIGLEYCLSFQMKLNSGVSADINVLITSTSTISNNITVTDNWQEFSVCYTAISEGSANGIQLRGHLSNADSVDLLIKMNDTDENTGFQLEQASNKSSFIYTNGAAATRDQDISTIDTLLEMGAFLETPENSTITPMLGNLTSGNIVNGVNTVSQQMTFVGSGDPGKYITLLVSAMDGAVFSVFGTDSKVKFVFNNTSTFDYILISGDANDFQYPAEISINWNRSTLTEAEVITLRTTAGDSNVWDAAVSWPTNNFKITHRFTYEGYDNSSFPRLFTLEFDTTNTYFWFISQNNFKAVVVKHEVADVDTDVGSGNLTTDFVVGDTLCIEVEQSSTHGTTVSLINETNGESNSNNDATTTADILMPRIAYFNNDTTTTEINTTQHTLELTLLTDTKEAWYIFNYTFPDIASLERINEQVVLLNERDADKNVVQTSDGSVVTYGMGEAAYDIDTGVLIEFEATNELTNTGFPNGLSDASIVGDVTAVTTGRGGVLENALHYGWDGITNSRAYKIHILVDSTDYVLSVFVEMDDGGQPSFGSSSSSSVLNDFVLVMENDFVDPLTYVIQDLGGGLYRVSTAFSSGVTSNSNIGVLKWTTNSTRTFVTTGWQVEQANDVSSYIESLSSAATRDADIATIDTLLEMGAYNETPENSSVDTCVSDRDDGNYSGGVDVVNGLLSYWEGAEGSVDGKYNGLITANDTGKIYTSDINGVVVSVTQAAASVSTVNYVVIKNPTELSDDEAMLEGFSRPATFSINHNRGSDTEAEVITLRTTAGDSNVWDAAVSWPTNNFSRVIKYVWKGSDGSFPTIYELYFDANNSFSYYHSTSNPDQLNLRHRLAGISSIINSAFTSDISFGDVIETTITLSSTNGLTLSSINLTNDETTSFTDAAILDDIAMPAISYYCNSLSGLDTSNAIIINDTRSSP